MGISDELWRQIEPLIPPALRTPDKPYLRRQGGGRKSRDQRAVFDAVLHVLSTRCAWQALPSELGSVSTTHRHFKRWDKDGLFDAIWAVGLAEHPELQGVHWRCEAQGSSGAVRWRPVSGALRGRPRKTLREQAVRAAVGLPVAAAATASDSSNALVHALQRFISRQG